MLAALASVFLGCLVTASHAIATSDPHNITANGAHWDGTTIVTYSVSSQYCQGTSGPQTLTLPAAVFDTSLNNTQFAANVSDLTKQLQIAFESSLQQDTSIPGFFIKSTISSSDPTKFWDLSMHSDTDGTIEVTGVMFNDSSNAFSQFASPYTHSAYLELLSTNLSTGGCTGSDVGYLHISNGASFSVKAFTNGSLTFDMKDAPLWCGDCLKTDVKDAGIASQNVGTLTVSFVSMPSDSEQTPSPGPPSSSASFFASTDLVWGALVGVGVILLV